jgi:hypothetical protein
VVEEVAIDSSPAREIAGEYPRVIVYVDVLTGPQESLPSLKLVFNHESIEPTAPTKSFGTQVGLHQQGKCRESQHGNAPSSPPRFHHVT